MKVERRGGERTWLAVLRVPRTRACVRHMGRGREASDLVAVARVVRQPHKGTDCKHVPLMFPVFVTKPAHGMSCVSFAVHLFGVMALVWRV